MTTSWHASPGTSTPCHSDITPIRQLARSWRNRRTSSGSASSPCSSTVRSVLARSTSAARSAALREEKSPRVRPPNACTSATNSAAAGSDRPDWVGRGRCAATYRMPCLAYSNGDPTSRDCHVPSPSVSPNALATVSKRPPSARVAEVATTVRSAYRWLARVPATDSGATTTDRRRSSFSTHATSKSASASSRWAVSASSESPTLACCRRTGSGSSAFTSPIAARDRRHAGSSSVNASRSGAGSPVVIRPGGASVSPSASASPASVSDSYSSGGSSVRARRAARSIDSGDSSAWAALDTRSASSCASSTTSSLCGGTMCRPASMSTASRLWLVTTMSASRARTRDASAKHSAPYGHRAAPTHSRAGIDT